MEIVIGGVYRHFKGNKYLVEGLAYNSENKELMVVYKELYGEGKMWVRPVKEFIEEIDRSREDNIEVQDKRFILINY